MLNTSVLLILGKFGIAVVADSAFVLESGERQLINGIHPTVVEECYRQERGRAGAWFKLVGFTVYLNVS